MQSRREFFNVQAVLATSGGSRLTPTLTWDFLLVFHNNHNKMLSYWRESAAACVSFGQSRRLELSDSILRTLNAAGCSIQTQYDVPLGLIEKHIVDLLLVLINFFASCYDWGATSENRSKICDFGINAVTFTQNFRLKGSPAPIIFARIVRPMNASQLCRWQFFTSEVRFFTENSRFHF